MMGAVNKAEELFKKTPGSFMPQQFKNPANPEIHRKTTAKEILEATSGMNLPLKVGPMLTLADVAVVTKIDRVSQAEREVFRARIQDVAPKVLIREVNALHGIGIDPLVALVRNVADAPGKLFLRGNPPVGTCTICVGKKEVGWQAHFGVVRPLEKQTFYRGE